jgi:type IV pilus assembly protein PilA
MLHKLRQRAADERGFTLIELLVVILIIGILAAIALPAFLNQREKAQDSEAKSSVRTAQTALETFYTDNQTYVGADKAALEGIEPALKSAKGLAVANQTTTGYAVTTESAGSNKNEFTITNAAGEVSRTCKVKGGTAVDKGGCKNGSW